MKRVLCVFFALVICFSALSGCTAGTDRETRNVVELTESNYSSYLEVCYIRDFVPEESDANLEVAIKGVLEYAYYEDVVLTFKVEAYTDPVKPVKEYEINVTLNAAGDAEFRVEYNGVGFINNGIGKQIRQDDGCELFWFKAQIRLESVSGKIIYTI